MAKDKKKYYYRDFLNPNEGTALIELTMSEGEPGEYDSSWFEGNLTLKDCNKQMNLEFGVYSGYGKDEEEKKVRVEKLREERLFKVRMLKEQLEILEARLISYKYKPAKPKKKKSKSGKAGVKAANIILEELKNG